MVCTSCHESPATVCRECVRAIALMFFGGISRHPVHGADCKTCEAGAPTYCGDCAVDAIVEQRTMLRDHAGYTDIRVGRDHH
jgi:hypothetical protein